MHYTHDEAERLAYLAGDTERAEAYGAAAELEQERDALQKDLYDAEERADMLRAELDELKDAA